MAEPIFLIFVDATDNHNKFYNMYPQGNSFIVKYGRVGGKENTCSYPMNEWNKKLNEKLKKGYTNVSSTRQAVISATQTAQFKPIEDSKVNEIVAELIKMAKSAIERNYTISASDVTEEMVDNAQSIINELLTVNDVWLFNQKLEKLFSVLPRKMKNVSDYLVSDASKFATTIQREQSVLDVMRGQIKTVDDFKAEQDNSQTDVLTANGLKMSVCTEDEVKEIIGLMGESKHHFSRAWRVTNEKTQKKFDEFVENNGIKDIRCLWHGSRNENFWSILKTGLVLRPTNAVITGKLFGNGCYFASKCKKSMGYTSLQGSYWANGGSKVGYMAVFEVAYGTPFDCYSSKTSYYNLDYNGLQLLKKGATCLHAHAGASLGGYSSLKNDEIVVYKEEQITVKYLVEIK